MDKKAVLTKMGLSEEARTAMEPFELRNIGGEYVIATGVRDPMFEGKILRFMDTFGFILPTGQTGDKGIFFAIKQWKGGKIKPVKGMTVQVRGEIVEAQKGPAVKGEIHPVPDTAAETSPSAPPPDVTPLPKKPFDKRPVPQV